MPEECSKGDEQREHQPELCKELHIQQDLGNQAKHGHATKELKHSDLELAV